MNEGHYQVTVKRIISFAGASEFIGFETLRLPDETLGFRRDQFHTFLAEPHPNPIAQIIVPLEAIDKSESKFAQLYPSLSCLFLRHMSVSNELVETLL